MIRRAIVLAGLVAALVDLTGDIARRGRLRVGLSTDGWGDARTSGDELLLRTAQELLVNVVKHADATSVQVELALTDVGGRTLAHLTVTDDGRGIGGQEAGRLAVGHLGLASRRIHVEAMGGEMHLDPAPSNGTRVEVRVPVVRH